MTVTDNVQQELQRGWNIHQQKRFTAAEQIYREVLRHAPQNAYAWCYLGIVLHDQHKYQDAVNAYDRALQIDEQFPVALNNRGNSLRYLGEFEVADQSFQRAIDLKPDYLNAYKNRGTLHVWSGNLDKGLKYYLHALQLNPNEAELHRNLGVLYLLQGRFEEGWQEYRWRWRVGDLNRAYPNVPIWQGQDLTDKSILLTAEQGLGDTLHFVRFAVELQKLGAKTLVHCQPQLIALLQSCRNLGAVYPNTLTPTTSFHYQCSLVDCADVLQVNLQSIPGECPYLNSTEQQCGYWQKYFATGAGRRQLEKLPADVRKLRVGIAWQGNPDHQADAFRSIPLTVFEPLAALPQVELISLQSGFGTEQLAGWQGARAITLLPADVDKSSGAFMDTAAIMQTLDLVVTSDTAIAHLAGGLGIPTWIALGYVPDWRWLLARDDTPWYPSARLFRQSVIGQWHDVFNRIRDALSEIVATRAIH
ncbi:MAG: glycosyltransferase family protein [Planctomycetales bacterium]|nr:glycosyltransferase family protein [Planctomycetales bacterium]